MNQHELMTRIQMILDDVKTAVLTTVDKNGQPHMRWMVPAVVKERMGAIYAVVTQKVPDTLDLENYPKVEWMFQTKALDKIVNARGHIRILDNPNVRCEVLEAISQDLNAFWKVNESEHDLKVLETVISEATYYVPMKGTKETVSF